MSFTLHHGDSLHILAELPDNSVDAVVTDPPYGFAFMGKKWDYDLPPVELWEQVLRVLKPGGHMLAFGGSRTYHRMVCAVEDAGFEIRDCVMWIYGSGFPKSLDISKAIDKAAGAEREIVSEWRTGFSGTLGGKSALGGLNGAPDVRTITAPATEAARQWDGWGTALKPAHEPIVLARKPLSERNVAANVLRWGTGGVNVDGCRIEAKGRPHIAIDPKATQNNACAGRMNGSLAGGSKSVGTTDTGRWPSNVIHDGSDEVLAGFPVTTSGNLSPRHNVKESTGWSGGSQANRVKRDFEQNTGSAARFFYCAKASRREREAGCEGMEKRDVAYADYRDAMKDTDSWVSKYPDGSPRPMNQTRNAHPTVKPIALMRYLCRLITPPNGIILDPFTGSGTTGCAAMLEGFRFIGIEREAEYVEIARRRIEHWREEADEEVTDEQPELFEAYA